MHEHKRHRRIMAHEREAASTAASEPMVFVPATYVLASKPTNLAFALSSILLPPTPMAVDEPRPKWVQVFITPSLEPLLITSLLDVPLFSQSMDMPHTQVVPSVALSVPLA